MDTVKEITSGIKQSLFYQHLDHIALSVIILLVDQITRNHIPPKHVTRINIIG